MNSSCFYLVFLTFTFFWTSFGATDNAMFSITDTDISGFAIFKDRMVPSRIYKILNFQTLSRRQCAGLCLNGTCSSFEMVGGQTCIFSNMSVWMTGREGYDSLVKAPGTTYYEASRSYLSLNARFPGVVFHNDSKYSKLLNNISAEECARACLMTPAFGCNSFAYNRVRVVCALSRDVINSASDVMKVDSYDTFQYSGNWLCNVTLPWGYSPRVIASSKYPYPPLLNQTCIFDIIAPPMKTVIVRINSLFVNSSECFDPRSGVFIYDGETDQSETLLSVCHHRPELVMSSYKSSDRNLLVKISAFSVEVITKITYDYAQHDSCDGIICQNGGSCIPKNRSYICTCASGFTGYQCEAQINHCQSSPCKLGTCVNKVDGYACKCYRNAVGRRCEIYLGACSKKPCKTGACLPLISGYKCICAPGYTGKNCEYDINECFSNPCINGNCIDSVNNYTCICESGFFGKNCQADETLVKCENYECRYGTCAVNESGSYCQCFPGWTGLKCEKNIDDCENLPCGVHGNCTDHINGFTCDCSAGFGGALCNISLADSCHQNKCINGYCSVMSPSGSYRCICESGYTGTNCDVIITPCSANPCQHGLCLIIGAGFKCRCKSGYTGRLCDTKMTHCSSNPCVNGKCVEDIQSYTCTCKTGWTGRLCDVKVSPCTDVRCNYGNCLETMTGFQCVCDPNHTGTFCDKIKDPCASFPCGKNGTCRANARSFVCHCGKWKTGQHCEYEMKPCDSSPCEHGKCFNHKDSYTCVCEAFYTGTKCQSPIITSEKNLQTTTVSHAEIHTTSEAVLSTTLSPCVNMTCLHGICISVSSYAFCICFQSYTGKKCDLKIAEAFPTRIILSTTENPNLLNGNKSILCSKIPCAKGICHIVKNVPVCVCDRSYTGRFCDTLVVDFINGSVDNLLQKRHNDSNFCKTKICLNGHCTENSAGASCVCDHQYTGEECEVKIDPGVTDMNISDSDHTLVTPVIENSDQTPFTQVKEQTPVQSLCSKISCINGDCVFKNTYYKCHCYKGFTGKSCNESLNSAGLSSSKLNTINLDRTMEYVAVGVVCGCLLLFVLACGFLWSRKAKRGSLYITKPSDFAANGHLNDQSAREINKNIFRSLIKQRKPETRCAFDLSSGVSDSSDDFRRENRYDDVSVHRFDSPTSRKRLTERPERLRYDGLQNMGDKSNKTKLHKSEIKKPPFGQITIRLNDKERSKYPQFQTVNGVEKGKSDA